MFIALCLLLGQAEADTVKLLKTFQSQVTSTVVNDRFVIQLLSRLDTRLEDNQLREVANYAATPEAQPIRWLLAELLIQRKQNEEGTRLLLQMLATSKNDRHYSLWKWWETRFGQRIDYLTMTHQLGEGLIIHFEHGSPETKKMVASLFKKDEKEAAMLTLEDIKKMKENVVTLSDRERDAQPDYRQMLSKLGHEERYKRLQLCFEYAEDRDGKIANDARQRLQDADPLDILQMMRTSSDKVRLSEELNRRLAKPEPLMTYLLMQAALEHQSEAKALQSAMEKGEEATRQLLLLHLVLVDAATARQYVTQVLADDKAELRKRNAALKAQQYLKEQEQGMRR